jgi:exonuclease SbcC
MQNNFPRVHSLSTIGIKQHFNCDYIFHPLRTDFSGESGSGKSMVADMFQLILVGSKLFKSSTESNKVRDVKGMVIKPKGKQHGLAYTFLNIEVAHEKYLVIGVFIESSNNKADPFIIQGSYDWESDLTALSRPIYNKDLLLDNAIQRVEVLQERLTDVRLKRFNLKDYHQLLFNNGLIALDFNYDKTLESYASILRSFSRGKGFKKDTHSLKKFLFGDTEQDRIMQKYNEEVAGIQNEFHEQERYTKEIQRIDNKQEQVRNIIKIHKNFTDKQLEYYTSKNWFWKNKYNESKTNYKKAKLTYRKSHSKWLLISKKEAELEIAELKKLKALLSDLKEIRLSKESYKEKIIHPKQQFEQASDQKKKIDKVNQWLEKYDEVVKLKQVYKEQQKKILEKKTLKGFIHYLISNNQYEIFEKSEWLEGFKETKLNFEDNMSQLTTKIEKLKALAVFSDEKNEDSLAMWAKDNLELPLTLEVESVLVHFQSLPREKPEFKSINRYLPFPKELFDNLKVVNDESKYGFWINLDGVYEYISYVPKQYLNGTDAKKLLNQLSQINSSIRHELLELEKEKLEAETLKKILFEFTGLEEAVHLFSNKEEIEVFRLDAEFRISQEEFDEYLRSYKQKDSIGLKYKVAHSDYFSLESKSQAKEKKKKRIDEQINIILAHFDKKHLNNEEAEQLINKRKEQIEQLVSKISEHIKESVFNALNKELFPSESPLIKVIKLKADEKVKLHKKEIEKGNLKWLKGKAETKLQESKNDYLTIFQEDFDFKQPKQEDYDPDDGQNSLKEQYQKLETKFQERYDTIKETIDDQSQLIDYSVGMLAHKLLPTVFPNSKIDLSKIDDKIAERLSILMKSVQEIGSRKVEILKRVLTEVYNTYNLYLEKILLIDKYLKKQNHAITGNNKASLKYKTAMDFPSKWMNPFRKQLDEKLAEVRTNVGLFEDLKKEIDINKMMLSAFQNEGGSTKAKIEDILNPKSYFDLDFDIKLESGESNAGSQGQTYTANALLGLARLSLIETKNRKGIQVMPIDEAEGLGNNYNMLHNLAKNEKYQIISMSIETAGEIEEGEQYIYLMSENNLADDTTYVPPLGIFSDERVEEDIESFIYNKSRKDVG